MMQNIEMKEAAQDQVTQVTPTGEIKASVVMMQTSEDETPIMNTMASVDTNSGIDPGEQIEVGSAGPLPVPGTYTYWGKLPWYRLVNALRFRPLEIRSPR